MAFMQRKEGVRMQKANERGALTSWRVQMDGQVRTRKQSDQARGTDQLESADRRTSQDTETIQLSDGHSLPGERRWTSQDMETIQPSEGTHRLESADRQVRTWKQSNRARALTDWRARTDGQVRTRKQSDRAKGTHFLESTDGQTSQDMKTI